MPLIDDLHERYIVLNVCEEESRLILLWPGLVY